jgi:DNA-binding MarR family transcriptional regulator
MSESTIEFQEYYRLMAPHEDPLAEARRLASLLVRAGEQVKADFAITVAPFELPLTTARALLLLDEPAPMRSLAEGMACDQSYITLIADDLEKRGLVTREPGVDRRVKVLTLTKTGAVTRAKLSRAVAQRSPIMARLDADDRATLDRLLTTVLADPSS